MSGHLNDYFGNMVKCFERNGGNVIKFVGDALMILFTDQELEASCNGDENQLIELEKLLVTRAASATLETHSLLHGSAYSYMDGEQG